MKRFCLLPVLLLIGVLQTFPQGAMNIKITEVMPDNRTSIVDEFGRHKPWVEISNLSFSSYNISGMYLTTNRKALNENLSPLERRRYLQALPANDSHTLLTARKSLVVYDNAWSREADHGELHLTLGIDKNRPNWIGLYDANATDLLDSVTVPKLYPDYSYSRALKGTQWKGVQGKEVTPGSLPTLQSISKAEKIKRNDPHGFGITVLAMGIVFFCLALLYAFFACFGRVMDKRSKKHIETRKDEQSPMRPRPVATTSPSSPTTTDLSPAVVAAIGMAFYQSQENVHDPESGIITIKRTPNVEWGGPVFTPKPLNR